MCRRYDSKIKRVGLGRISNDRSDPKYSQCIYLYDFVSFIKTQISQTGLVTVTAFLGKSIEIHFAEISVVV